MCWCSMNNCKFRQAYAFGHPGIFSGQIIPEPAVSFNCSSAARQMRMIPKQCNTAVSVVRTDSLIKWRNFCNKFLIKLWCVTFCKYWSFYTDIVVTDNCYCALPASSLQLTNAWSAMNAMFIRCDTCLQADKKRF